jgi:hypothetical protein
MKHLLFAILACALAVSAQAADVGVSVSVGQPGFYGRIDIGNAPRPEVVYSKPVVIRPHAEVVEEPIYLRVPPGHAKHWRKKCSKYNACGRPVYFVKEQWYNDVYVPHHRAQVGRHGDRDGKRSIDRNSGNKHEREIRGHGRGHRD